ncbi:hypothetical protein ACFL5Z_01405 [Planctomycetota bacterium]
MCSWEAFECNAISCLPAASLRLSPHDASQTWWSLLVIIAKVGDRKDVYNNLKVLLKHLAKG